MLGGVPSLILMLSENRVGGIFSFLNRMMDCCRVAYAEEGFGNNSRERRRSIDVRFSKSQSMLLCDR